MTQFISQSNRGWSAFNYYIGDLCVSRYLASVGEKLSARIVKYCRWRSLRLGLRSITINQDYKRRWSFASFSFFASNYVLGFFARYKRRVIVFTCTYLQHPSAVCRTIRDRTRDSWLAVTITYESMSCVVVAWFRLKTIAVGSGGRQKRCSRDDFAFVDE